MTSQHTLDRLAQIQAALCAVVEALGERDMRQVYHPDLSPLGWHLGHCAFIERYWLWEVALGNDRLTADLHTTYFPELAPPKPQRGVALPPRDELLSWARQAHGETLDMLSDTVGLQHPLFEEEYLQHFLIQHGCQHLETMQMALTQRALQMSDEPFRVQDRLTDSAPPEMATQHVPGAHHCIGTAGRTLAYDNETPPREIALEEFTIATRPVSNAQYLGFMQDGGYQQQVWWSDAGRRWLAGARVAHPDAWRCDASGGWYGLGPEGPCSLQPDAPVTGISYHEAQAFARWAADQSDMTGARLPHEFQWEAASRLGRLEQEGRVWEWCRNSFAPYPGFRAFPYDGYSVPWFDGEHYVLRGGSRHTRDPIKRPGFRNFYNPGKRHIFSGVRLVFE